MPTNTIDDLLAELEGAEKTAEESFNAAIVSEEDTKEEQTKEAEAEETDSEEEEKVASEEEEAVSEEEEKVAEETVEESEEETAGTQEKTAEEVESISADQLVKIAEDMGKVMARSCAAELVALGIMPATNEDIAVPPISQVSLPSQSPVTVAADAEFQAGGKQEKTASVITEETLTNMYNKYYSEDN